MCCLFAAAREITVNQSLPLDLSVSDGDSAVFHCRTAYDTFSPPVIASVFSVALLLRSPANTSFTDCYSCSFSYDPSTIRCNTSSASICKRVKSVNRRVGLRTHELESAWGVARLQDNGTEVVCAVASQTITQWANTATLTVLPTSPSLLPSLLPSSSLLPSPSITSSFPSSSSSSSPSLSFPYEVLAGLVVLFAVCAVGVALGLVLISLRRRGKRRSRKVGAVVKEKRYLDQGISSLSFIPCKIPA